MDTESQLEAFAYVLATHAHGYQQYGNAPYTVHLHEVRDILVEYENDHLVAAGWLHDILEDTKVTESELRMCFPGYIVDAVVAVTGTGHGRKAKLESIIPKLEVNADGRILKLADRLANVRSCIRGMEEETPPDDEEDDYIPVGSLIGPGREILLPKRRENYYGLFDMYQTEWPSIRPHLLNIYDGVPGHRGIRADAMVSELDALLNPIVPPAT